MRSTIYALLYTIALWGCGSSEHERQGNAASALSELKRFQTATLVYETHYGGYGTLPQLLENDPSGLIGIALGEAWDGQPDPKALKGYLFASMDADEETERVGLCAYPSANGKTGDLILCTFADLPEFATLEEARSAFVELGDRWSFYAAASQTLERPPPTWPEQGTPEQFTRLTQRDVDGALEEAWQIMIEPGGD